MKDLVILNDDREKKPYDFEGLPVEVEVTRLTTGDYTTPKLRDIAAVERKSLDDLAKSVTRDRDRFKDEIHRARDDFERFAVVIEHPREPLQAYADRGMKTCPLYYSKVYPRSITGTVDSWEEKYNLDFHWLPNRQYAALKTYQLLTDWEVELVE